MLFLIALAMTVLRGLIQGSQIGVMWALSVHSLLGKRASPAESLNFYRGVTKGQVGWVRELVMHSAAWGMLGLFLGLGSGLVLRSSKKIAVGMVIVFGGPGQERLSYRRLMLGCILDGDARRPIPGRNCTKAVEGVARE